MTSIGDYAFSGCEGFTGSLTIPAGVTSIGDGAFSYCTGFNAALILSEGVQTVGENVFYNCGFTAVRVPLSLISVGEYAFCCSELQDVYYTGSESDWQNIQIAQSGNDDLRSAEIHYNYI